MGINREKDNWLFHAQGYLKLARLCCQELLRPRHHWSEGNSRVPEYWRINFPIKYHVSDLLPGTLFNIKHGIEIFLKSALIDLGVPNYSSHDTVVLFAVIKKLILEIDWQPVFLESGQSELSEEEIVRIQTTVTPRLEELIIYFRDNQILDDKLKTGAVPDPKNQLFRYPEIKKGAQYDFDSLIKNIEENDIQNLLSMIDELYEHLNDIGFMFAVDARHKPRERR